MTWTFTSCAEVRGTCASQPVSAKQDLLLLFSEGKKKKEEERKERKTQQLLSISWLMSDTLTALYSGISCTLKPERCSTSNEKFSINKLFSFVLYGKIELDPFLIGDQGQNSFGFQWE